MGMGLCVGLVVGRCEGRPVGLGGGGRVGRTVVFFVGFGVGTSGEGRGRTWEGACVDEDALAEASDGAEDEVTGAGEGLGSLLVGASIEDGAPESSVDDVKNSIEIEGGGVGDPSLFEVSSFVVAK